MFSWKIYFTNKGQIRILRVCVIAPPPCDELRGGVSGVNQSSNLLASRTPVPNRYIGQGRDSKPSESGSNLMRRRVRGGLCDKTAYRTFRVRGSARECREIGKEA